MLEILAKFKRGGIQATNQIGLSLSDELYVFP